jgi:hypothetical protein
MENSGENWLKKNETIKLSVILLNVMAPSQRQFFSYPSLGFNLKLD